MIKTILNTLLDSFCCIMLVSFLSFGLCVLVMPFFTADPLWASLFCVPFLAVACAFLSILERSNPKWK